jgi:hypothetical protein
MDGRDRERIFDICAQVIFANEAWFGTASRALQRIQSVILRWLATTEAEGDARDVRKNNQAH